MATILVAIRVLNETFYQKVVEVESLNETLETRVAARTRELETANLALKKEILERHRAEDEAAQSREERLKMKGEFLSHVSHGLRSPLAVVHQFTTVLLDGLGGPLTKNQKEYLDISLRNVNQLKYMIDDLLEVRALAAGAEAFLQKPVDDMDFLKAIQEALSKVNRPA